MRYAVWKRCIDITGALTGFLIITPFTPLIALAIIVQSPGPALVRLRRVSAGRIFYLYKFRTMIADAEDLKIALADANERRDGPFFKITNDPRVTAVGRWLRRFRIDESPQFINVLKNDISLVGPRPYAPEEIAAYPAEYQYLANAKAGITGPSQISGSSTLSFKKTVELDDYYVKNQSVLLDLKIIVKTIAIFLFDHTAV